MFASFFTVILFMVRVWWQFFIAAASAAVVVVVVVVIAQCSHVLVCSVKWVFGSSFSLYLSLLVLSVVVSSSQKIIVFYAWLLLMCGRCEQERGRDQNCKRANNGHISKVNWIFKINIKSCVTFVLNRARNQKKNNWKYMIFFCQFIVNVLHFTITFSLLLSLSLIHCVCCSLRPVFYHFALWGLLYINLCMYCHLVSFVFACVKRQVQFSALLSHISIRFCVTFLK